MKTTELLDQVKAKTGTISDYKLAQVLDFSKQKISDLRSGKIRPDAYECARIAIALERDPLEVMAEVGAETAKTEKAREFWKSFFSGMKRKAHVVALSVTCGFLGSGWPAGSVEANLGSTSHNGGFCSRIATAGRNIRAWWTTKFGPCSDWSGCFGS